MSELTIIKPRHEVTDIYYTREFRWKHDPSSGYSFPCDKDGNLLPGTMAIAKENYDYALNNDKIDDLGVVKTEYTYMAPAIGKCSCGCENEIIDIYMGAFACDNCGQWYNLSGQALEPPDKWDDYGELEPDY